MLERVGAGAELNLALLTLHPEGLRPYIANWNEAAPSFVRRLQGEMLASGDAAVRERFEYYVSLAGPLGEAAPAGSGLLPILPIEFEVGALRLSLFSVIATFGTPQDVTTDELRIETFYPTDSETEAYFASGNR